MTLKIYATFLSVCLFALTLSSSVWAQSGRVFRDFNNNGIADANDVGLSNITVQCYRADGSLLNTAQTGPSGSYTFSPGASPGEKVRVEFVLSASLSTFYPTAYTVLSGGSGTSVQFVTGPAADVNYGLSLPGDFCDVTPPLSIVCFVIGAGVTVGGEGLIATIPSNATGTPAGTGGPLSSTAGVGHPNTPAGLVGAIWGTAWQPETGRLFSSAFMRRHTAFGIGGTGGIYVTENPRDPALTISRLFINLNGLTVQANTGGNVTINTGTDPHMTVESYTALVPNGNPDQRYLLDLAGPNSNPADAVGKISLGDMDLSSDQRYLYVVNPGQNHLYRITIDADNNPTTNPTAADVRAYLLPSPGCVNGTARPFGLGIRGNKVYVGTVCDGAQPLTATGLPSADNLNATVYVLDTDADQFSTAITFPLNYSRGAVSGGEFPVPKGNWQPWNADTDWSNANTDPGQVLSLGDPDRPQLSSPQPMLTDIAFDDDGALVLGFSDRFGHMAIFHGPDPVGTRRLDGFFQEFDSRAGGDILRICNVGTLTNPVYQLEQNGKCGLLGGGQFTDALYGTDGTGNPIPGEFEYYTGDNFNRDSHTETTMGSVAIVPGSGELIVSAFDPIQEAQQGAVYTNGFKVLSNTTGQYVRAFSLLNEIPQNNGNNYFGKASGLGGIEVLCLPKSLEIGNRVWFDANRNGIQDADEAPIEGVQLELLNERNEVVGSATTDAEGRYLFNQANVIDTAGVAKPNRVGLQVYTTYSIRVAASQFTGQGAGVLANLIPTITQGTSSTANVSRDNNASLTNGRVGFSYRTGQSGENDHTLDLGFQVGEPLLTLSKVVSATQVPFGAPISYTLTVRNTGTASATGVTVQDLADSGLVFVSATASVGAFTPAAGGGTWLLTSLAPNESAALVIQATANQIGTLRNQATLGNQTVTVTTEIVCPELPCVPIMTRRLIR